MRIIDAGVLSDFDVAASLTAGDADAMPTTCDCSPSGGGTGSAVSGVTPDTIDALKAAADGMLPGLWHVV